MMVPASFADRWHGTRDLDQLWSGRVSDTMTSHSAIDFAGAVMAEIRTRVLVDPDHRISGTAPAAVPPGEHEITITVVPSLIDQRPCEPFDVDGLPTHDLGPW